MKALQAGELREIVEVLTLTKDEQGNLSWTLLRKTWAQINLTDKRSLFSSVGTGTCKVQMVVRRQKLMQGGMLRWRGQTLYISTVMPRIPQHLDVNCAMVTVSECRRGADEGEAETKFPGILTEKYVRHDQPDFHGEVTTDYVLVTPKKVSLSPGCVITCDGKYYRVLVPHELDEFKNEYEIRRREDC